MLIMEKDLTRIYTLFLIILVFLILFACQNNSTSSFPVLHFNEDENKQFIFTNKNSGFFTGNSHRTNKEKWEGWYIDGIQYLIDYQLNYGSKIISRDSVYRFSYYPYSFSRVYASGLMETFTLLDSINAIIWEFESESGLSELSFIPVSGQFGIKKQELLSANRTRLIIPPHRESNDSLIYSESWLGFNYFTENANRVIVVAAKESNKETLIELLDRLVQGYSDYKLRRLNRMSRILQLNKTYTNIPEITDAIKWSQLSLDALTTEIVRTGIEAGLPVESGYLGRNTFISMTGTLLITGQFQTAKKILDYFGKHQLTNKEDSWYGRIPNKITSNQIDFNTADVTWWYIRALYEYFLFSGDIEFARYIYPVVKRAIEGAIRFRIDEKFYLTHQENETWMNQSDDEGCFIPRGNRAVEIQSLWYTALLIGSKLASWNDDPNLEEHWLAISQSLRKNFQSDYWKPFSNRMYDHLTRNGSADRSVRPNIIFTVSVPHLPGIDPLINDDIKAHVTNTVLNKLTFRYGTTTLWQKDRNFVPWINIPGGEYSRRAYHNGPVWHWLTGPLISSLLYFNLDEIAFYLYSYQSNQILYENAIAYLASLRDARPLRIDESPTLSINLSSAMSLAEFVRNFYQDFIGYRPDVMQREISLTPVFPSDLKYVSTILPYASGRIYFTYFEEDNLLKFEISKVGEVDEVDIVFNYPGFDAVQLKLDDQATSVQFSLDPALQRSYSRYSELDWHFAQWERTNHRD